MNELNLHIDLLDGNVHGGKIFGYLLEDILGYPAPKIRALDYIEKEKGDHPFTRAQKQRLRGTKPVLMREKMATAFVNEHVPSVLTQRVKNLKSSAGDSNNTMVIQELNEFVMQNP